MTLCKHELDLNICIRCLREQRDKLAEALRRVDKLMDEGNNYADLEARDVIKEVLTVCGLTGGKDG